MKSLKTALLRAIGLSLFIGGMAPAHLASGSQIIHGQTPSAKSREHLVKHLESSKRLSLAIGLPLRNGQALTNLLRDLYDPQSPRFHQFLTETEFAAQFGPTEKDYQAVRHFAEQHGLKVSGAHSNRTLLDVNGTVADVEKVLHLRMQVYQHPTEARTFFAPDSEPSLDIDVPLLSVSGLNDFVLPHPMNLKKGNWDATTNITSFVTGSGPSGYFLGGDFRAAYAPGVTLNGAGQSVGLFELDGYYPNDIADYEILAKLPNIPLTNILLDGFSGPPGNGNLEVALDIDMAICMAPGLAQIRVYEGTVPNDVLNQMATENASRQLSCSWGFPINASTEQIFLQYAAQGQSFFQASGDSGAYGGVLPMQTPCDDPNVTVVGGTSLTTTGPGGAWVSETAWSGSGGGISPTYTIPSWQQSVSMSANQGSTIRRNIPDVSCLADLQFWLIANNGSQGSIGGSSAATPLWAGFAALINQQAAANGRPYVGFLNPAIYSLGQGNGYSAAFHDITTGSNTNHANPTNFFAVPGYDLCTGWGTPTGSNLINALALPPDALGILPATNFIASGAAGGPFNPAAENFVLTNSGTNLLDWAASANVPWLALSTAGGALSPGGAIIAAASLNANAASLPAGSYTALIRFTNTTDGFVQVRQLTLAVVTPPVITQQPSNQSAPVGGTASFTVGTASNALLYFQWQENGTNLADGGNFAGSATSNLIVSNVNAADAGLYRVVASNAANFVISSNATLSITSSAPIILSQPASQAAPQGAAVVFTVAAAGNAPLTYQWQWDTTNLADGANVSGSSSSALTLTGVSPINAGSYSVIVSNSLGSTASSNAVLTVVSFTVPGVTLSTLYSFTGGLDGGNPNGLFQHTNGNFYGTTPGGGSNGVGSLYRFTTLGAFTNLMTFTSASSGATSPAGALVQGLDGNMYGVTRAGGGQGYGAVFRATTNGVQTRIGNFNNTANGAKPVASLIVGLDGFFYGSTQYGGANNDGTVFRIATNGLLASLASFNYFNGAQPTELHQGNNGFLYGTTYVGGANGNGTVFQCGTNGALTSLASFNYTNGGSLPYAGFAQSADGTLFGTTYEGGAYGYGTIYSITPSGTLTTIYSFTGAGDGGHPAARLTTASDGNFYGVAGFGGTYGGGTIFRLSRGGNFVTLAQFDGYDGAQPQSALIQGQDGALYGTTAAGGTNGAGTIFRVNINSPVLQISDQPADQEVYAGANAAFSVAVIGNGPFSFQWTEDGTNLTDGPGVSGSATRVLTLTGVSIAESGVYSVTVSNATGTITSDDAILSVIVSPPQITQQPVNQFGTVGGSVNFSVAALGDLPLSYQWRENGTNLTDGPNVAGSATSVLTLSNLAETNDGSYSVMVSNSVAAVTSTNAILTVYAVSLAGTTMTALHGFTGGNDGGVPNGLVLGTNGILYGTTQTGGAYGDGTIFSLSTNGIFTTLLSFDGTNGAMPVASLIQGTNGLFYGTTQLGGSNLAGTLFSVTTNGALASLYSFSSNNDSVEPFTSLALDAAGDLYGAASNNASAGNGTIFAVRPDNSVTNIYSFPGGLNGTLPAGALALGPDGNFYGATISGGAYGQGNVFKMTPAGAVTTIYSFTGGADGYHPAGQLALGADGNFYGVTEFDILTNGAAYQFYGTIFKITPTGALTTLYKLNGTEVLTDGAIPEAGLIQGSDGNFYGTTYEGFFINDNGVIFNNSQGTIFGITPAGNLTTFAALNGSDDGSYPQSSLVQTPDGSLYGTATAGGPSGQGAIFRITFTSAPQITTQPVNQTVIAGATATFDITLYGARPLFYQWQKNGANLTDGGNISGTASRILTISNAIPANAGTYSVIVSNALGAATSASATLTVQLPAPSFQSAIQTGGSLVLTWSSIPGESYQLQSTSILAPATWTNQGPINIITDFSMSVTDAIISGGQKFYRVLLTP